MHTSRYRYSTSTVVELYYYIVPVLASTRWLHNSAPDEILPCGRRSAAAPSRTAGEVDVAAAGRRSAEPACRPTSWRIHRGVARLQQASGPHARACAGELNVVGREGEREGERVNFGHAQHDAAHADGARHAQSAWAAHCDHEKVRHSCLCCFCGPWCPKFTRSMLILVGGAWEASSPSCSHRVECSRKTGNRHDTTEMTQYGRTLGM